MARYVTLVAASTLLAAVLVTPRHAAHAAGPLAATDPVLRGCSLLIASIAPQAAVGVADQAVPMPPTMAEGKLRGSIAPPTDREIRNLVDVLGAMSESRRSPAVLAALARGEPFSFERFAAILEDTRSVLVGIHARDLLREIGDIPNLPPETLAWYQEELGRMIDCPPLRFQGRGGTSAFEQTRDLVQKYRRRLEPLVFNDAFGGRLSSEPVTDVGKDKAE